VLCDYLAILFDLIGKGVVHVFGVKSYAKDLVSSFCFALLCLNQCIHLPGKQFSSSIKVELNLKTDYHTYL